MVGYDPHEADSPRLIDLLTGGLSELNLADTESDTSEEQSEDEEYENGTYVYHDEDEDNTQSDIAAMYGDGCSSMGDIHEVRLTNLLMCLNVNFSLITKAMLYRRKKMVRIK